MKRYLFASIALALWPPLALVASQATTTTTQASEPVPTEFHLYPDHTRPDFPFIKIPLREACDILRLFYNSTGGPDWTINDGWEMGAVLHNNPEALEPPTGHQSSKAKKSLFRRAEQHLPRLPTPTSTGPPPVTTLHPANCCGWYGVVCVGPDGVMPPPWPPYDDDYDPHSSTQRPGHRRHLVERAALDSRDDRKRHPPYRPPRHYSKDHRHHLGDSRNRSALSVTPTSAAPSHSTTRASPRLPTKDPGDELEKDWYIVGLALAFNNLVGPIPECLGNLPNLMVLNLSNNELSGPVPRSIGNLTHLRRLDLSSNLLQGSFPEPVTHIVMLQELILKNNYMTGNLPDSILKMKQLTQLSIANNEFDNTLPVGMFGALKKLRVFNIDQNGFTGGIESDIGELEGLIKFTARANELKGSIPAAISRCKRLEKLDLGDNHLAGELPEEIFNLTNLLVLDLTANKLRGSLSPRIGKLVNLSKLVLSHNAFTGPLPVELQNLTRLEFMVVNYNHFDGIFPISRAPPLLNICLVQPNSFSGCPPEASVNDSKTLAYQCNLDCSDRVIHPEVYDALSKASQTVSVQRLSFLITIVTILFTLATL